MMVTAVVEMEIDGDLDDGAVEALIKERLESEAGPTVTVESVELEFTADEDEDEEDIEDLDVQG